MAKKKSEAEGTEEGMILMESPEGGQYEVNEADVAFLSGIGWMQIIN